MEERNEVGSKTITKECYGLLLFIIKLLKVIIIIGLLLFAYHAYHTVNVSNTLSNIVCHFIGFCTVPIPKYFPLSIVHAFKSATSTTRDAIEKLPKPNSPGRNIIQEQRTLLPKLSVLCEQLIKADAEGLEKLISRIQTAHESLREVVKIAPDVGEEYADTLRKLNEVANDLSKGLGYMRDYLVAGQIDQAKEQILKIISILTEMIAKMEDTKANVEILGVQVDETSRQFHGISEEAIFEKGEAAFRKMIAEKEIQEYDNAWIRIGMVKPNTDNLLALVRKDDALERVSLMTGSLCGALEIAGNKIGKATLHLKMVVKDLRKAYETLEEQVGKIRDMEIVFAPEQLVELKGEITEARNYIDEVRMANAEVVKGFLRGGFESLWSEEDREKSVETDLNYKVEV